MKLDWLFPIHSTCLLCGKEDKSSLTTGFCSSHLATLPKSPAPDAVFSYEEPIRSLIQDWKFHNKRYLSQIFADLMREKLATYPYDLLTFVPISESRQKERGYNQVELLCQALDAAKTLPLLGQIKDTPSQTSLHYHQRLVNRLGVYHADGKASKKHILLLDDVRTTGATLTECRNVLLQAGAASVSLLALAAGRPVDSR